MSHRIKNAKPAAEATADPSRGGVGTSGAVFMSGRFSDLDQVAEVARAWQLDFARIDRTPFAGRIAQLDLGEVRYDLGHFSAPLEQRGSPPPGGWTIALPAAVEPRMSWRGRRLEAGMIPVYRPDSEIDAVSAPGFFVVPVTLSPSRLARLCEALDLPAFERRLQGTDVLVADPRRVARLGQLVREVFATLDADSSLLARPAWQEALRERLPALLLRSLAGASPSPASRRRDATLARCLRVIAASDLGELTVGDLAAAAGVSPRAVQLAFARRFGVSPKTYLMTRQLNAAHRLLQQAPPGSHSTDIARACGFWHMGQFAADYRRMFGELPSQTLARRESGE